MIIQCLIVINTYRELTEYKLYIFVVPFRRTLDLVYIIKFIYRRRFAVFLFIVDAVLDELLVWFAAFAVGHTLGVFGVFEHFVRDKSEVVVILAEYPHALEVKDVYPASF